MKIKRIAAILLLGILLVSAFACGGGMGPAPMPTPMPTPTPTSTQTPGEEEYLNSYIEAHNEMAEAERYYNSATDYLQAQMYEQAVGLLSQAKEHATKAILASSRMGTSGYGGEKEWQLASLAFERASYFYDAMGHFITSVGYLRSSNYDLANEEIRLGNEALQHSWDCYYEMVQLEDEIPLIKELRE